MKTAKEVFEEKCQRWCSCSNKTCTTCHIRRAGLHAIDEEVGKVRPNYQDRYSYLNLVAEALGMDFHAVAAKIGDLTDQLLEDPCGLSSAKPKQGESV